MCDICIPLVKSEPFSVLYSSNPKRGDISPKFATYTTIGIDFVSGTFSDFPEKSD
ncbi:hypothetical protein PROFUN_00009 [Planoprotostelium fungivorum]|uniref:Uncharacterized protein n=1 Tax=Planoprotostelium fungivorum TaxID=1890364 RepID=A0A2P6P0F5_9EUKA|nr:hypothetical protein PROFUN_00009 [Planoprotostelium fungivorum]